MTSASRPGRGRARPGAWRDPRAEEMGWLQYLLALLLFNALGGLALFALLMLQGVLPFNPQHLPGLSMGSGAQYRDQLCQQYQLAGLRRRKHHELSQPDGRPDGAEFPLRRHRHRRGLRPDPRLRPAENVDPRQCLGSI